VSARYRDPSDPFTHAFLEYSKLFVMRRGVMRQLPFAETEINMNTTRPCARGILCAYDFWAKALAQPSLVIIRD
jgi:hypothetical protein